MIDILALDIATSLGWARGLSDDAAPAFGSINFAGRGDASDNAIMGNALRWLSDVLEPLPRPGMICIEAMLPPSAMRGRTNTNVRDRLAGLHGVIRAVAFLRGVYRIEVATVGDVRGHFIGDRGLHRAAAKREVTRNCHRLGWHVADDNAADACAVWSYARSLVDPVRGLKVTPLFGVAL